MKSTVGLRFIICGNNTEVGIVTKYLDSGDIKYVVSESTDLTSLTSEFERATIIWYNGSIFDQYILTELTNGKSLF